MEISGLKSPLAITMFLTLMILMVVLLAPIVFAERTVKTIEYPLGYVSQSLADIWYVKGITLSSPDGISKILSSEIYVKGDFQANTRVYAEIEGQNCNPVYWTIPNQDVANYNVIFDCSDLTDDKTSGTYAIRFKMDKVGQNIYARAHFTYYNNPKGSMAIFGTEYYLGESATVFLQLKDNDGNAVNEANCYLEAYYPNQPNVTHQPFLTTSPMMYLTNSSGIYYYDLFVPNVLGVYMMSAECSYVYQHEFYYEGTENQTTRTVEVGTYGGSTLALNEYDDGIWTECSSGLVTGRKKCIANYDWVVDDTNITDLDFLWLGASESSPTIYHRVWNWTDSSWIDLPNTLTLSGTSLATGPTGIDEYLSNVIPDLDNTIAPNNTVKIQVESDGTAVHHIYENWLNLKSSQEGDFITDLKGSGEMNVHAFRNITIGSLNVTVNNTDILEAIRLHNESMFNDFPDVNWNATNRTLTDSGQLWIGGTEYSPDETTGKIVVRLVNVINQPVDDATCVLNIAYPNNTIYLANYSMTFFNGTAQGGIYYADFPLTGVPGVYPYGVDCEVTGVSPKHYYFLDTFHIFGANRTKQAEEVWEYPTRTLTWYEDVINYTYFDEQLNTVHGWFQTTWTNQTWWGNHLNNTITAVYNLVDWWGWELENKIDSIILGNVTVNATVDYDEIAITVMQYLYALERIRII